MRFFIILCMCLIPVVLHAQQLDGAYILRAAQYGDEVTTEEEMISGKSVKIFKDGYWITGFFGDQKRPFGGAGGGTYTVHNGKYVETLRFYSWDSTAVGKTYTFDYRLENDRYFQSGLINSDKYQNYLIKEEMDKLKPLCDLKDASLEGVWLLQESSYEGKSDFKAPIEQIKIYAYPRFAWARYNTSTGQFLGTGGGSYYFDGKKLIEHIEYITHNIAMGTDLEIEVSLEGNKMEQTSWNGRNKEKWRRAK